MQGHRSACEAAPVLFANVRLALIHERCFILLSGLRSERLLILDFAWVSVRMGIGRSGAVHPARPCHRHRTGYQCVRPVRSHSKETAVKPLLKFALLPLIGAASASAFAAPHLTPRECHGYPFVRPAHEVTHQQLMQELHDLSLVGYDEHAVDNDYPSDLQAAEQRLAELYRQDCGARHTASTAQPTRSAQAD